MENREIRIELRKCVIIFIGYISLIIASIAIWIQHIFLEEFHIIFPVLFMVIGLGVTTPIIIKLVRRDFKLILREDGFINETGFNKSKFLSWSEVNTISIRNGNVCISLLKDDEFLKSSSLLVKLVAKINKASITLVNWYLEENAMAIYHMMHNYAFQYKYNNLDMSSSGEINVIGLYDTPYMESYVSMIELEVDHENVVDFVERMSVFTSLIDNGNSVLPKIVYLNDKGLKVLDEHPESKVKRFLCFVGYVREGTAIETPFGYVKLPRIEQLPERLGETLDFRNIITDFRLYKDVRTLNKSDLVGTPYVEFSSRTFNSYRDIENWREDSIYFDLESAEISLLFVPKEIKFQIFSVHSFTKEESQQFISNMLDYMNDDNLGPNYSEILKEEEFQLDDGTYFYLKHINGFLSNKEIVKGLLRDVIEFIEKSDYEFSILGI